MNERIKKIRCFLLFLIALTIINFDECIAKISLDKFTKLTMENTPEISEIATLKIVFSPTIDTPNIDIFCFLPEPLDIINDKSYNAVPEESLSGLWGNKIILWSGILKAGESKEFILKVRIPDGRKYVVYAGGIEESDTLELDLGDPEPPELDTRTKEGAGIRDGKRYILVEGMKQIEQGRVSPLAIPEDSLPPLRTELRIRTKDRPYIYIKRPYNGEEIPLRYLVYTEGETQNTEVTVELPEGLELINDQNYEVTAEEREGKRLNIVKLFQGPLRFKECKAFYFKLRSDKQEDFNIKAQTKVTTPDGKELIAEDYQEIRLGRGEY